MRTWAACSAGYYSAAGAGTCTRTLFARSAGRSLHGRGRAARGCTYGVLNACMLAAAVVCVSVFAACGAGYYQPNTGQTGCLGTLSCALDASSPTRAADARSIVHSLAAPCDGALSLGCTAGTQSSPGSASCTSTWMHAPTPRRRRPSLVFFYRTGRGRGALYRLRGGKLQRAERRRVLRVRPRHLQRRRSLVVHQYDHAFVAREDAHGIDLNRARVFPPTIHPDCPAGTWSSATQATSVNQCNSTS